MKGVVFDLFGTLCVKTSPEHPLMDRYRLDQGLHDLLEEAFCGYRFDSWDNYLENIMQVSGVNDKAGIKNIIDEQVEKGVNGIHPEAEKVLKDLAKNFKIGLVSTAYPGAEEIVEKLSRYFSAITFSYQIGMTKRDSDIYIIHLKNLGVEKACMVGDSLKSDILMSRQAGYGKGILIGKEKGDWVTVSDLSEVPEAIRSGNAW